MMPDLFRLLSTISCHILAIRTPLLV